MDSSKAFCADNRHRTLFHSTAGIYYIQKIFGIDFDPLNKLKDKYNLPGSFVADFLAFVAHNRSHGVHLLNSADRKVNLRYIAEQHVLEDFRNRFIPTFQDYLNEMNLVSWMDNAIGQPKMNNIEAVNSKTQINIAEDYFFDEYLSADY